MSTFELGRGQIKALALYATPDRPYMRFCDGYVEATNSFSMIRFPLASGSVDSPFFVDAKALDRALPKERTLISFTRDGPSMTATTPYGMSFQILIVDAVEEYPNTERYWAEKPVRVCCLLDTLKQLVVAASAAGVDTLDLGFDRDDPARSPIFVHLNTYGEAGGQSVVMPATSEFPAGNSFAEFFRERGQ